MAQEFKTTEGMVFGLSAELTTAEKHIAELEAKVREWEAWFEALELYEGGEPPAPLTK